MSTTWLGSNSRKTTLSRLSSRTVLVRGCFPFGKEVHKIRAVPLTSRVLRILIAASFLFFVVFVTASCKRIGSLASEWFWVRFPDSPSLLPSAKVPAMLGCSNVRSGWNPGEKLAGHFAGARWVESLETSQASRTQGLPPVNQISPESPDKLVKAWTRVANRPF